MKYNKNDEKSADYYIVSGIASGTGNPEWEYKEDEKDVPWWRMNNYPEIVEYEMDKSDTAFVGLKHKKIAIEVEEGKDIIVNRDILEKVLKDYHSNI